QAGDLDHESLQEDLKLIAESADMIIEIKEQLIGKAREQKPRPVMPADIVQAAAIIREVPARNFHLEIADNVPLVLADSTQLTRAFGNIIQNSLEAEAENISVDIAPAEEDGFVAIRIHDDGVGIPEDVRNKIWTTFYTTKGSDEHHGLGLASSLHIITQLEGRLTVSSKPGKGTTMVILLPIASTAPEADLSKICEHVSLIDDDDLWANYMAGKLTKVAKTLERFNDASAMPQSDIILVDRYIESASFEGIKKTLLQTGDAKKTVILTPALQVEHATEYIKAGFQDVVLKPYTMLEVANLLKKI
ncbi:MAG: HAMP domain-containing sensor histidine kinase, partial [Chloroflexota bacterium]|nr:HAMP domain-containing sensor histidine kinase [Chloroflexota bacterium]